jgi:glycosyltransferase involved in cell wall biosynthesis
LAETSRSGMPSGGQGVPSRPALYGILITFRRPEALTVMLARLLAQDRLVDRLIVVDNDPSAESRAAVEGTWTPRPLDYIAAPHNLGPAGGIELGMRRVLELAADEDWVMLLDDDDPPASDGALGDVERFAHAIRDRDPRTAGVGLVGARFDWRRGRPLRLADAELVGEAVPVDYVGGNQLPTYLVGAVRRVGPFRGDLFFGFDDLEFGLRLGAAGYRLYADGNRWRERRARLGRLGMSGRPSIALDHDVHWRRYYGLRNTIAILRVHGRSGTALRVAFLVGLGKPAANLVRAPRRAVRHLRVNWHACRDGWRGRLGRTVGPEDQPRPELRAAR